MLFIFICDVNDKTTTSNLTLIIKNKMRRQDIESNNHIGCDAVYIHNIVNILCTLGCSENIKVVFQNSGSILNSF